MPYGPSQFQLTVVKPYYKDNSSEPVQDALEDALEDALKDAPKDALEDAQKDTQEKNYNKHALEGDYNSNIIIVDIPQP